jgi:hypothetical protein
LGAAGGGRPPPHRGLGKLVRRLITERTVRSHGVVVHPPRFDLLLRVRQAHKPVLVEAFVAKLAVEALAM